MLVLERSSAGAAAEGMVRSSVVGLGWCESALVFSPSRDVLRVFVRAISELRLSANRGEVGCWGWGGA